MSTNVLIRQATRSDIPVIADFQMRLALETENVTLDPATLNRGINAMFDDPSKGFYRVACVDDEIVGCHMITFEWSDWRNGMVYWLQSVFVKEPYRKAGVFRSMFNALRDEVLNNPDIRGLRLYVDNTNKRAQSVYSAMGMNGDHYSVFELMK